MGFHFRFEKWIRENEFSFSDLVSPFQSSLKHSPSLRAQLVNWFFRFEKYWKSFCAMEIEMLISINVESELVRGAFGDWVAKVSMVINLLLLKWNWVDMATDYPTCCSLKHRIRIYYQVVETRRPQKFVSIKMKLFSSTIKTSTLIPTCTLKRKHFC